MYKISVVMAVYNTEEYLEEAIESVVGQTIGFGEIQLILVDDGSTDRSGVICDHFRERYPDNIEVIHQNNSGRAAASNAGLELIKGRYVNFLDSDDVISEDTFSLVYDFFEDHGEETDLVSVPMVYFGGKSGEHPLNYKYKKGTRVVSLWEEEDVVQLHLGSAFVRARVAEEMHFDETQVVGIDARECMRILLPKMSLGLVAEGKYYYRIREGENLSILQAGKFKKKRYAYHLERFSLYILELYRQKYGEVPAAIQYMVMYELQSRIRQKDIPEGVLSDEETECYKKRICEVLAQIGDAVISGQRNLNYSQKIAALSLKYGESVRLEYLPDDVVICVGDREIRPMSTLAMQLEKADIKGKTLYLEGYMNFVGTGAGDEAGLYMDFQGKRHTLQKGETKIVETWLAPFNTLQYFSAEVSLDGLDKKECGGRGKIVFYANLGKTCFQRKLLRLPGNAKHIEPDRRYRIENTGRGELEIIYVPGKTVRKYLRKVGAGIRRGRRKGSE